MNPHSPTPDAPDPHDGPPQDQVTAATEPGSTPARHRRYRGSYRAARRRRRRAPAVLSLNLTAMIDTVFNLLFFFMVASRFGAIEGLLSAPLPGKSAQAAPAVPEVEIPRTPLRIRLLPDPASPKNCRAVIEPVADTAVTMAALPQELSRIRQSVPGFDDARVPVYLVADDNVTWDHVVNAYNAAMVARYERIFFAGGS